MLPMPAAWRMKIHSSVLEVTVTFVYDPVLVRSTANVASFTGPAPAAGTWISHAACASHASVTRAQRQCLMLFISGQLPDSKQPDSVRLWTRIRTCHATRTGSCRGHHTANQRNWSCPGRGRPGRPEVVCAAADVGKPRSLAGRLPRRCAAPGHPQPGELSL